jgi:hypothetical protein
MLIRALLMLIAGPAEVAAPDGWFCRVSQPLASGWRMDLVQSVDQPGSGFAVHVQLHSGFDRSGTLAQHWHWSLAPGEGLAEPRGLFVHLRLTKVDRKGRIRADHAGGSIDLPSTLPTLFRTGRTRGSISVEDRSALRLLWASPGWRLSVLDRQGRVRGAAEGLAPPRAEVEEAFSALSASLAGMVAAPARHCEEAGPDSTI